ncbi:succinate dehydrogenase, hydrophobic membrane anchor protein [Candidatus Blochmanniella vafra str. BVAF]|uniref:Succinate dehydrogenase hydrophobic membrane anchor subunit n=1 Tax=Blochmanniella vafra (strain BVAF) TaxID=859654 RepID=E8Q6X7_BLOVB|nr:succinate dehydrogenase, hydrophobic membrane anchor protein [Candidatus Blochmannia vafer]ADV33724.1 succinate dehydrogenase, hydrophobic membrane anchor protein [Candidatus Blochmannia vafer str. BVAF]
MVFIKKLNLLKKHGVYEWLIVRFSAMLMILYILYILNFMCFNHNVSYEQWRSFFYSNKIRLFSIIILFFVLQHTWIGIRHVLEDYIKSVQFKRLGMKLIGIVIYTYLLSGIVIIWGV